MSPTPPLLPSGMAFAPGSIAGMALIGAAVFALASVVTFLIRRGTRHVERHLTDVTGLAFVSALAQMLTYLFALVVYAHLIPELRSIAAALLTGVSVLSVVIGVAAQNTIGNLIAGFSLVLSRTLRVGDSVRLDSPVGIISAKVRLIALGSTVLVDVDGHEVVVPNSVIMGSAVTRIERAPGP